MKDGVGSALLTKPQVIKEMIVKARDFTDSLLPVSIKIRIDKDLQCVYLVVFTVP